MKLTSIKKAAKENEENVTKKILNKDFCFIGFFIKMSTVLFLLKML